MTTKPLLLPFAYKDASAHLFGAIATDPWAVFLDSGGPHSRRGRYDIIAAAPSATLVTRGAVSRVVTATGAWDSADDPFSILRELLGSPRKGLEGIPFSGGAIGYFAYDLGRRLERLPQLARDDEQLPELAVGIYDWALVVDHQRRCSWLAGWDGDLLQRWHERLVVAAAGIDLEAMKRGGPDGAADGGFRVTGEVRPNMSRNDYLDAIAQIQHYIREGDCYQVNFARRFSAPAEGAPWHAYLRLRQLNPAPFSAYLNTPRCQVMSSSPESFLRLQDGLVETRPIKGTAPRDADPVRDRRLARELETSTKDRAENLMIVDLLRNDLGRVCVPGSIEVPDLFMVESYARVHHLVSRVRGRLAPGQDALSLLRACFPGGSITGAPKVRAMEIIEQLEPQRRGVYCGAIGYIGFDGNMETNIAIRTLVHGDGCIRLWAGGGIVQDSDPELEYEESGHKASALLDLLRQMGGGGDE